MLKVKREKSLTNTHTHLFSLNKCTKVHKLTNPTLVPSHCQASEGNETLHLPCSPSILLLLTRLLNTTSSCKKTDNISKEKTCYQEGKKNKLSICWPGGSWHIFLPNSSTCIKGNCQKYLFKGLK